MMKASKLTKFVKRNKVVTVLVVVFLLAVILAPSLYFGLKSSKQDSTRISSSTYTSESKFIDIHKTLAPDSQVNINIENYDTSNLYIKFNNLLTYDLQADIDSGNIQEKILELIKFKTDDTEITFNEVINTNARKLLIKNKTITTGTVEEIAEPHSSYFHTDSYKTSSYFDTNSYIDIDIMILTKYGTSSKYMYNVFKHNSKGKEILIFRSIGDIVFWKPIKSIIINKYQSSIQDTNEIERHPLSSFIIKTNTNDFPIYY